METDSLGEMKGSEHKVE